MFDTNGFYEFKTDIFKILNERELNIFFSLAVVLE